MDEKRLQNAIRDILIAVGDDPSRGGLLETPKRAAKMLVEMLEGMQYTNDEIAMMLDKSFIEDTLTNSRNLVVLKDIEIFSFCEHHLALMYDMTVDIAYIPNGRVLGLSKLARIADLVSKRLQLQERITQDILYIIKKVTNSTDIFVRVKGCHSCVAARGIKKKSLTVTKAKIGEIKESELD